MIILSSRGATKGATSLKSAASAEARFYPRDLAFGTHRDATDIAGAQVRAI
jgi:hypothetical protein